MTSPETLLRLADHLDRVAAHLDSISQLPPPLVRQALLESPAPSMLRRIAFIVRGWTKS